MYNKQKKGFYSSIEVVNSLMSQVKHFPILIEMDEDGFYIVSCPQFKGCRSYGTTIDEAMENIREAIELCLMDSKADDSNIFIGFRELELIDHA